MKYVFNVYQLECGDAINTQGTLIVSTYVYCPECRSMRRVVSAETHSQEIDDIEELPE